ncbi:MAG: hypothetical protein ACHREM_01300 [Polyangiales bacterium]
MTTADPQIVAVELVRAARSSDHRLLDEHVDWPFVRRLAAMDGAFDPTLADLVRTLSLAPATCTLKWRVDDGGLRLDFPPAMTDDTPEVTAEKTWLKRELYQGKDIVALCADAEQFLVQLLRDPSGRWHIRGWTRLAGTR